MNYDFTTAVFFLGADWFTVREFVLGGVRVMVLYATFNNISAISWRSVLW